MRGLGIEEDVAALSDVDEVAWRRGQRSLTARRRSRDGLRTERCCRDEGDQNLYTDGGAQREPFLSTEGRESRLEKHSGKTSSGLGEEMTIHVAGNAFRLG
jgi:hypothetical protein